MAKIADQSFYDAALNVIRNTATRMTVVTTQPTVYASTYPTQLAQVPGMSSGDFTLGTSDQAAANPGRKVTVAAKTGITVTTSGTANWVVLDNGSSTILYVTSCTSVAISGTVNFPTWKIDIAGPS